MTTFYVMYPYRVMVLTLVQVPACPNCQQPLYDVWFKCAAGVISISRHFKAHIPLYPYINIIKIHLISASHNLLNREYHPSSVLYSQIYKISHDIGKLKSLKFFFLMYKHLNLFCRYINSHCLSSCIRLPMLI